MKKSDLTQVTFLCLCFVVVAVVAVVVACLRLDIFISFLVIAISFYARVHDDGNSSLTFLPVGFTSRIISPTICFMFCQYDTLVCFLCFLYSPLLNRRKQPHFKRTTPLNYYH